MKKNLPRLAPEFYQGQAWVFWTHTLEERHKGWLTESFHARFREILLHAQIREPLVCPLYVLMPDHFHLLWMGLEVKTDQRRAGKFLRSSLRPLLSPYRLQRQPHDHVLREKEREKGSFLNTWLYIARNPERAGLVDDWKTYPFLGSLVPGYPDLDPRDDEYLEKFWRLFYQRLPQTPE